MLVPQHDSYYITGGTLPADASSCVERRTDGKLLSALLAGEYCYVLNSRQMGKSSLMVRAAQRLKAEGVRVAVLDLTSIGQNLTQEQWYSGLIDRLGTTLDLLHESANRRRSTLELVRTESCKGLNCLSDVSDVSDGSNRSDRSVRGPAP